MVKSPDAFRTISEVADWLDRPTHVLRFWESKFPQIKPVKRAGGRRYYRPQDMLLLGGIKRLLHDDGMTIKGVQKILREQGIAHVVAMSQALDADMAVGLVLDQVAITASDTGAPMVVLADGADRTTEAEGTGADANGSARVLPFRDVAARDTASFQPPVPQVATESDLTTPAPVPVAVPTPAPPTPAPPAPIAAPAPAANWAKDQPALPFDAPDTVPGAAPDAVQDSARDSVANPMPMAMPEPVPVPRAPLSSAPAAAASPLAVAVPSEPRSPVAVDLLAQIARQARPLLPDTRAALLPLVQRLVPLARRMRAGFAARE